ncbi:hypothetical protein EDD22DRAFT_957267 [Suillus occidentalis]|nr:hypothetical protein EDD22DRAFT_957267 [Suillus occidentalis]
MAQVPSEPAMSSPTQPLGNILCDQAQCPSYVLSDGWLCNSAWIGPSDHAGHLVSATMLFSAPEKAPGVRGKVAMKKTRMMKTDHIRIDAITRVDFIQAFSHLVDRFKWGGETGASTVDNDHDFTVARDALLKKRMATCNVSVEFDLDAMEGFRTPKQPISHVDAGIENKELLHGTKVPRVDIFSDEVQLTEPSSFN